MWRSMATFTFPWDPSALQSPGPRIKFRVNKPLDDVEEGEGIGLEYSAPIPMALIDTGSPFTIVNRILVNRCGLRLTNPATPIKTLAGNCILEAYCGSISFPESNLPPIREMQIFAADLNREIFYSALIGRDILRRWDVRFNGPGKLVTITV